MHPFVDTTDTYRSSPALSPPLSCAGRRSCVSDRKVRDAKFAFEAAMDAGLNFFDTAGERASGGAALG